MKNALLTAFLFIVSLISHAQPVLVADFNPGSASGINEFNYEGHYLGDLLIFPVVDDNAGLELAVLEEGEMRLLKDINPGAADSNPGSFVSFNGLLYFVANDGQNGSSIWATDGTEEGTFLAIALNDAGPVQASGLIVSAAGELFFTYGGALYKTSDGETVDAILDGVEFLERDGKSSANFTTYGAGIAFLRKAGSNILQLYAYQDSLISLGQELMSSFSARAYGLGEVEGGLVFAHDAGFSQEELSGTFVYQAAQDTIVKLPQGLASRFLSLNNERRIAFIGDKFYSLNADPSQSAILLSGVDPPVNSFEPIQHATIDGKTVFHADSPFGSFSESIALTGGTAGNTSQWATSGAPYLSSMATFGQYVFFAAGVQNNFDAKIYYVDTEAGTFHTIYEYPDNTGGYKSVQPVGVQNGRLYFASALDGTVGRELYYIETGIEGLSAATVAGADFEVQFTGPEFVIRSGEARPVQVQVFDVYGRLLRAYDTWTNVAEPVVHANSLLFYVVKMDGQRLVRKWFRP